jgi:hypothetical protein
MNPVADLITTLEKIAVIKEFIARGRPVRWPCGCMGPQDGDPVCPCEMQWVVKMPSGFYRVNEVPAINGILFQPEKMNVKL